MKVIVCVKQVPDTSGKVAVKPDGTLDRASMAAIINPDDKKAICGISTDPEGSDRLQDHRSNHGSSSGRRHAA